MDAIRATLVPLLSEPLHQGDPAALDRETALVILAELERLQARERHLLRLQEQLHAIVGELDRASTDPSL